MVCFLAKLLLYWLIANIFLSSYKNWKE
jgi:hypothetical protein